MLYHQSLFTPTKEMVQQIIPLKCINSEDVDFCITSTPKKSLLLDNNDRSKNLDSVLDCSESCSGANNSSSSSSSNNSTNSPTKEQLKKKVKVLQQKLRRKEHKIKSMEEIIRLKK